MHIHGILAIKDLDKQQEVIDVETAELDVAGKPLSWGFKTEVDDGGVIGTVLGARLVTGPDDCLGFHDRMMLQLAGDNPFVKVACNVFDKHVIAALTREMGRGEPERETPISFAAGGRCLGYRLYDGGRKKVITGCLINEVTLTLHGVHYAYRVMLGRGSDLRL